MKNTKICYFTFFVVLHSSLFIFNFSFAFAQTPEASRTDGVNVYYYDTLHEAVIAANGTSFEMPDEISILSDLVLDEPLIINDNVHIRLVANNGNRTITRSINNIEFPVIWLSGESASLTLGKPDMEYELVIDGGYLNNPAIEAQSPLIAVNGPDLKLIMYDKVVLQNNCNVSLKDSRYNMGGGVFINGADKFPNRQPEFIMKGGTIRGNINRVRHTAPFGGGILAWAHGIFTMEGGIIMNNTARRIGGGVYVSHISTFRKTGGIIYGADAPEGFRNTALEGVDSPKLYGHAVCVGSIGTTLLHYRNDTVRENDFLTHTGSITGPGVFGKGEKWDNQDKVFMRKLLAVIIPLAIIGLVVLLIVLKRAKNKGLQTAPAEQRTEKQIEAAELLSPREKEVFDLLLTDMPFKQIASALDLTNSGVTFHSQNIYRKLRIKTRTELLVKFTSSSNRRQ